MVKKHLVTFSDKNMSRSRELCIESGLRNGIDFQGFFTPENLQKSRIVEANPSVFRQPDNPRRAWAWWAWKPLIIDQSMRLLNNDDILIYSDAGVEFINNVNYIIDRMDQDIFLFGNNWEHAHWCKGDVAYTCWPDYYGGEAGSVTNVWGRYGKQVQASVIFFRASDYSRKFVTEWLKWCLFEGGRLIDDTPSHYHNHPEFQEHRHDQAILTTMAYRDGLRLHWWPAIYNGGQFTYDKLACYGNDTYPPLFHHHRKRNWEFT